MSKITLVDPGSFVNDAAAVAQAAANNDAIEAAIENTLSRDGSTPNEMLADLDMNSKRILNLPSPVNNTEPLRLADIASSLLLTSAMLSGTSTSSVLIDTGAKSFTTQTGKAWVVGQHLVISSTANTTNYMHGAVTSYDTATGALVMNILDVGGSGTYADWTISLTGPRGAAGVNALAGVPLLPSGRLSLSNTSAVPTSDITAATTIYYVDMGGGVIPIWDIASSSWIMRSFTGSLSLALDSNSGHLFYHIKNQCFDVYAYWDSALGQVRLGITNTAGTDFSQRGVGISGVTQKNGIWVNSLNGYLRINATGNTAGVDYIQPGTNAATYLGSFGTTATDGQTEDSVTKRLVYNAYNGRPRNGAKKNSAVAYNYATATPRQVNADTANQIVVVIGLAGSLVTAYAVHHAIFDAASRAAFTYVYIDGSVSPAADSSNQPIRSVDASGAFAARADYSGYPAVGKHTYAWYEAGIGAGTATWQPDGTFRNGLFLRVAEM